MEGDARLRDVPGRQCRVGDAGEIRRQKGWRWRATAGEQRAESKMQVAQLGLG